MFSILRPLIFNLEPEIAHDLAIQSLKTNLIPKGFFRVEGEEMLEIQEEINIINPPMVGVPLLFETEIAP